MGFSRNVPARAARQLVPDARLPTNLLRYG